MNEIRIFKSEEFGEIRTVEIGGEPWFVGKDVAEVLGYAETANIRKLLDEADYKEIDPQNGLFTGFVQNGVTLEESRQDEPNITSNLNQEVVKGKNQQGRGHSTSIFYLKQKGRETLMEVLKDKDCTINTPVVLGVQDSPIYGKGISIKPRVDGRKDSKHFESIYLPELLPLEEYDLIVVLISAGKDSIACFYKLLELGVPKEKIELWHHDIDGGHPSRRMDWKCTQNYMKALANAEGVKLRVSYRVNGFFGELYRIGASEPIEWIDPDTDEVKQCKLSSNYLKCQEIKEQCLEEMEDLLKEYGCRMKFPAKSPDLSRRWCSAYLKVMVADSFVSNLDRLEELGGKRHKFPAKGGTHQGRWCSGNLKAAVQDSVTANLEETKQDKKILIVSGERRGESAGRSKYNEIEIHRTNAEKRNHRIVHQWRCCIDYTEKDVWEVLKRHHVNPHPCYRLGWNRCSCAACIFSTPGLMKGFSEIYPDEYKELRDDEERLGFTLDNKKNLDDFICGAKSCLCFDDKQAVHSIKTGEFTVDDIFVDDWKYPVGAFHGSDGGSC